MDYTYFNPTQAQHYPYLGMQSPTGYPSTGMDPDTLRSIEPLEAGAGMLPQNGSYDAFSFAHGLAISHGSPLPHTPNPVGSVDSGLGGDMDDSRTIPTTRSSSEEKDTGLTPAQSRRKAQNRAAQRAFRERKERHVRDLEAKLSLLESSAHSLQSDNERLKLALQRARTENEILRATSAQSPSNSRPVSGNYTSPGAPYSDDEDEEPYNVQSLPEGAILTNGEQQNPVTKKSIKTKDIPASQLWDVIQSHHLVKQGIVDVADVCERLKGVAKCSGTGPVYDERLIWAAIESSRRSGGDELI